MSLHPDIIAWSRQRPMWQQDALRRLVEMPLLTQSDIDELVALCKAEHGISLASPVTSQPLVASGTTSRARVVTDVILEQIQDVHNVNVLDANQVLLVGSTGLTAVYGDNGAGKSGYVRILKQVCRARGGADDIYPNVYAGGSQPLRASLSYRAGSVSKSVTWQPGLKRPPELREISIFDSRSASVYVTDEQDVAYLPHGMDLFPRLVRVVDAVRLKLESEISQLSAARDRWQDFEMGTKVHELLQNLHVASSGKTVAKLAVLSEAEKATIGTLRTKERKFKSDDPAGRAVSLRQSAARIRAARKRLAQVELALSDAQLSAFQAAHGSARSAKEAARLALSGAFADVPIEGVGSESWKILWEAARQFAVSGTKETLKFPPVEGAVCVLCQSPVGADAAARMKGFDIFVRGETEKTFRQASALLESRRLAFDGVRPQDIADATLLAEVSSLDASAGRALQTCMAKLKRRQTLAASAASAAQWQGVEAMPATLTPALDGLANRIEAEAVIFESAAVAGERQKVDTALREFAAREQLAKVHDRVMAQLGREQLRSLLDKCVGSANTTPITRRNTDLLAKAVTKPLADEFARQLAALNLTHIPISLEATRGEKAKALHTLHLGGPHSVLVETAKVLSEGEHRCIALAAFFAEVSLQDSKSTLVFDDPVSSLDQSRREYVAQRIVQLAQSRPVLLFTHDLVFLSMLQTVSERLKVSIAPRLFWRDVSHAGMISTEWPWYGQKAKSRIGVLKQSLVLLTKLAATDRLKYEHDVREFYGRLRDTWERAVEDHLLNGAIQRFGTDVKTSSLANLHKVTEQQLQELQDGMSKSSKWLRGHDHAAALGLPVPAPAEALADLASLEKWVSEMKAIHN